MFGFSKKKKKVVYHFSAKAKGKLTIEAQNGKYLDVEGSVYTSDEISTPADYTRLIESVRKQIKESVKSAGYIHESHVVISINKL